MWYITGLTPLLNSSLAVWSARFCTLCSVAFGVAMIAKIKRNGKLRIYETSEIDLESGSGILNSKTDGIETRTRTAEVAPKTEEKKSDEGLWQAMAGTVETSYVPVPIGEAKRPISWQITSLTLVAGAFFSMGYFYRDHQLMSNIQTYHNVHVDAQHSPDRYKLTKENGEDLEAKWCKDYLPHWLPGSTLLVLTFEERGSCKTLSGPKLGYVVARNENDGNPIITEVREVRYDRP